MDQPQAPNAPVRVVSRVHANALAASGGPFDVALDFGYNPPEAGQDPSMELVEWQVRIMMSWEHLASMLPLLQTLVEQYEERVGPIPDVAKAAESLQEAQ
jgi:hypothetical protein